MVYVFPPVFARPQNTGTPPPGDKKRLSSRSMFCRGFSGTSSQSLSKETKRTTIGDVIVGGVECGSQGTFPQPVETGPGFHTGFSTFHIQMWRIDIEGGMPAPAGTAARFARGPEEYAPESASGHLHLNRFRDWKIGPDE